MLSFDSGDPARHVLVTGLGMVTPLAATADATWRRLCSGDRAGRTLATPEIDHADALAKWPGFPMHGAPVDHRQVAELLQSAVFPGTLSSDLKTAALFEPSLSMALVSLAEALQMARLTAGFPQHVRGRVIFGSSKGGLRTVREVFREPASTPSGDARLRGLLRQHAFDPDAAARAVATVLDIPEAVECPVAACATGLIAILMGAMRIQSGDCDVCIVGSSDAALQSAVLASFHRLRVTSRHHEAAMACRPFDRNRDGFIAGEGAATLVLESRAVAEQRGATPLAQVLAGGWLTDPTGITQVDETGTIVRELLSRVLAGRPAPGALSLHGTGTVTNDLAEARGVAAFFPPDVSVPCFGVKGAIGHLLGAAGSVESAIAIRALQENRLPGTTNLTDQDPACPIRLSPRAQDFRHLPTIARLSLGFGGHVACGLFGQP